MSEPFVIHSRDDEHQIRGASSELASKLRAWAFALPAPSVGSRSTERVGTR
jgi:hypothetical protein